MQKYRATPKALLFDGRCSGTHVVPVPVHGSGTSLVTPEDLDIRHWLLITQMEREDAEVNPPAKQYLPSFLSGPLATNPAKFIAYITPQRAPFRPSNRCIRILSGKVLQQWYGNIVICKVNEQGYVVDIEEKDIGLVEHLMLR